MKQAPSASFRIGNFHRFVVASLALGAVVGPAVAQESQEQPQGEAAVETSTTYIDQRLPLPAWLGGDSPQMPDWAEGRAPASSFLRPGLGTSSIGVPPLAGLGLARRPRSSPLRLGPIDLWPRLSYELAYGSGLLSGPGREEATWVNTVRPGLVLGAGDHWTVGYVPSIRIYSAEGYQDTVNHAMTLGWRTEWHNWAFRLNHATDITSDPLIETATQTDQTIHSTGLGATWDLGRRGAFDFALSQNIRLSDQFSDSYSWASQNWYEYPWTPKLRVGLGWGFGYDSIEPGADMSNQRVNVRLSGELGEKVSFTIGGGGEWRFFYGTDADTVLSPLVNATLRYQVLERTTVSVAFARDVNVSYFSDQFTENTSIQGGVVQMLAERWSVFATGGYRFTTYRTSVAGTSTARQDGTSFIRTGVTGRIATRVSATLAYAFGGNDSDLDPYAFDSNQVSLQLNWAL